MPSSIDISFQDCSFPSLFFFFAFSLTTTSLHRACALLPPAHLGAVAVDGRLRRGGQQRARRSCRRRRCRRRRLVSGSCERRRGRGGAVRDRRADVGAHRTHGAEGRREKKTKERKKLEAAQRQRARKEKCFQAIARSLRPPNFFHCFLFFFSLFLQGGGGKGDAKKESSRNFIKGGNSTRNLP